MGKHFRHRGLPTEDQLGDGRAHERARHRVQLQDPPAGRGVHELQRELLPVPDQLVRDPGRRVHGHQDGGRHDLQNEQDFVKIKH